MPVFVNPSNYDGVARSQVPAAAPQYSGVSQAGAPSYDQQRQQWLENRAAYYRAQAQQAQLAQQQQAQTPQITPSAYAQQGGFNLYSQDNPGRVPTPEGVDPRRNMNFLEQGIAFAGNDLSNAVNSWSGFDPEKGFTLENMAAFVASLPTQMVSGILQAPANFASGITGNQYLDNPYTEQLEVDTQNGTITTETLDGAQRAAQMVNGVINSGLTGASGQLIRSISPLWRSVGEAGRQIMRNAPKAAQVGFSMGAATAEEAGEEFVQSYLDDISFDHLDDQSFDRAVEGAKWGALGGGIMSGAGHGISYVRGKLKGDGSSTQDQQDTQGQQTPATSGTQAGSYEQFDVLQAAGGSTRDMKYADKRAREARLAAEVDNTPGSTIVKHSPGDYHMPLDELHLGVESVESTYRRSSQPGRENILRAFNASKDEFELAMYQARYGNTQYSSADEALTALLMDKTGGKGAKIAIARNPDTREGGFYVDLKKIIKGPDVVAHPAVYTIFGADLDGDTSVLYFDPGRANVGGYASQMWYHPEGRANVSDYYLGIRTDIDDAEVLQFLHDNLDRYGNGIDSSYSRIVEAFSRGKRNADIEMNGSNDQKSKIGSSARNATFAHGFNMVSNAVFDAALRSGMSAADASEAARSVVNNMLYQMSDNTVTTFENQIAPQGTEIIKQELERAGEKIEETGLDFLYKMGTTGNMKVPVDTYLYDGYLTYVLTGKSNPMFRQYSQHGYSVKAVDIYMDAVEKANNVFANGSAMEAMIRASFRMVANGISPAMACEGMVDSYVITRVLADFGSGKIRSKTDYDLLMNSFVKHYNDSCQLYNKAKEVCTEKGYVLPYGVIERHEIGMNDETAKAEAFLRVFGNTPISVFFDTSLMNRYAQEGLTLKQLVEPIADQGDFRVGIEMFAIGDQSVQDFLDRIVKAFGQDKHVVSNSAKAIVLDKNNEVFAKIPNVVEDYLNGRLSFVDQRKVLAVLDALSLIIDPDDAFDAGLRGIDILSTELGQMLFSRNSDTRLNALYSIGVHQQFRPYIDALRNGTEEEKLGATHALLAKANVSTVHRIIVDQLLHDDSHQSALFDFLVDTGVSYAEKERSWNETKNVTNSSVIPDTSDLFFDSLNTETSEFAVSGYSVRLRQAKDSLADMQKLLYEEQRKDIAKLKELASVTDDNTFVTFFKQRCKTALTICDERVLGMKLYAAASTPASAMEKGVNETAGTASYLQLMLSHGGRPIPYLSRVLGEERGISSADEFANNKELVLRWISDPTFVHEVEDNGDYLFATHDDFMKSIDETWEPGQSLDKATILKILEKYPHLVDMLTDNTAQVTMTEGMTNVQPAKKTSLSDMFAQYRENTLPSHFSNSDSAVDSAIERGMIQVSNELMNWGDYSSILTFACGEDLIKAETAEDFVRIASKTHRQLVRALYCRVMKADQGELFKENRRMLIQRMLEGVLNDMTSVFDVSNAYLFDSLFDGQMESNMLRSVQGAMSNAFFVTSVYNTLQKIPNMPALTSLNNVPQQNMGTIERYLASIQARSTEAIDQYNTLFSILYKITGEKLQLTGELVSDDIIDRVRTQVEADIDSSNLSDTEKKNLKSQLETAIRDNSDISTIINAAAPQAMEVITDADMADKAVVLSKALVIYNRAGMICDPDDVTSEVEKAFSDGPDSVRNLVRLYNGTLYESYIKRVKRTSNANINANMVTQMHDTIESIDDLVSALQTNPRITKYDSSSDLFTDEFGSAGEAFPKFEFWSDRLQAISSQLKVLEKGAPATTSVGVNGSYTKKMFGWGFLRPAEGKAAISRTMSVADFTSDRSLEDSWKCTVVPEGQELHGRDVMTVRALRRRIADGSISPAMVRVFDPNDNAHGISYLNEPSAPERTPRIRSRIGSILGLLQDDSQEAMVLKAKKKFLSKIRNLVDERKFGTPDIESVDGAMLSDPNTAYSVLRQHLIDTRKGYATDLYNMFRSSHDGAELNNDAALILAQALTPAYRIHMDDGSIVMMDVIHLFRGQDDFNAAIASITNGRGIVKVSLKFAEPREISGKITKAVADESRRTGAENMTIDDANDIAFEAVQGWDGVDCHSLSVDRIMARANPIGFAHGSPLVTEDSRTPVQYMYNALYGGRYGSFLSKDGTTEIPSRHNLTDSEKGRSRITSGKNLVINGIDFKIIQSFLPRKQGTVSMKSNNDIYLNFGSMASEVTGQYPGGLAIVPDYYGEIRKKANKWAVDNGNGLLVRKSDFQTSGIRASAILADVTLNGSYEHAGLTGEWVIVDPTRDLISKSRAGFIPQSDRKPKNPNSITTILVDTPTAETGGTYAGFFNPGDAGVKCFGRIELFETEVSRHSNLKCADYLLDKKRPYTLASKSGVMSLVGQNGIDWDKIDFRAYTSLPEDYMRQKVEEFINRVSSSTNPTGIVNKHIGHGDIVGFVTDGFNFAPVMLPDSAPIDCDICGLEVDGGNMIAHWKGKAGFGRDNRGRVKLAIPGISFKAEAVMAEEGVKRPTIPGVDGELGGADLVISWDTYEGRAAGRGSLQLIEDLHYYTRKMANTLGYSYVFDSDGNVKPEIEDLIKRACGGVDVDAARRSFLKGEWGSVWNSLMAGTEGITNDPVLNNIISDMLVACKMHGINPMDLFDPRTKSFNNVGAAYADFDVHMVFRNLNDDQVLRFYHGMDQRICPNGIGDVTGPWDSSGNQPFFDNRGRFAMTGPNGNTEYRIVHFRPIQALGDASEAHTAGYNSSYAWQHINRRSLDFGFLPSEARDAIHYAEFIEGDPSFLADRRRNKLISEAEKARALVDGDSDQEIMNNLIKQYPLDSYSELEHKRGVIASQRDLGYQRKIVDVNGDPVPNPWNNEKLARAVDNLKSAINADIDWNHRMIEVLAQRQAGFRRRRNGENTVRLDTLASNINQIAQNIREHGVPIMNMETDGTTLNDRYALPRLSRTEIDWFWNSSKTIQERWSSREEFEKAVKKAADESLDQTVNIVNDASKRRALLEAFEGDYLHWDDWDSSLSPYVYGGSYMFDLVEADNKLADAIRIGGGIGEAIDADEFKRLCERERGSLVDVKRALEASGKYKKINATYENGKVVLHMRTVDDRVLVRVLDNATTLSQIMALLNPGVLVGNMLDRYTHQGITKFGIWLAHRFHMGPFATTKKPPSQQIVRDSVNNEKFMQAFIGFRQAGLNGEELDFIANANGPQEMAAFMQERRKNMTPFQRAADRIYGASSGGNKFIKTQMENFINRFAMFAEEAGQDFWFQPAPGNSGLTVLEAAIQNDPARWFADILGSRNGMTPSYTIAMQALNSAKMGDMAQRNVLSMLFTEAVKGRSLPKFFVTTCVCRFPQYALNVSGRMLNWVMPMSSINYVFTNMVADAAHRRAANDKTYIDPHFEQAQVHRSLREAMLVDITHLGVTAVSAILVGMAGGIEPPEDEEKWGNIDEWTVCGLRVGEAWWLEDILGMALPTAAFAKAMTMGKPRFDILFNGATQVMYNNPILKVADVIGFLADPEGQILTNYQDDYNRFKDSRGGAPSLMDWVATNFTSLGLNWGSQFILPSALKEWYTAVQPYEVSYRKIYEENAYGQLTEGGAAGEAVMDTTYQDAMLRRLTRRNPVLGWLADMVINPNTGYLAGEMPRTRYLDDAQLAMMEQWSIEGMEPKEAEAKLLEIVAVMQGYDNMEELRSTGFYLDSTTKAALSSLCWDTVKELDNWYNSLQADGYFDYYAWGDGDYNTGQEAVAQIKIYYNQLKDYWTDFYYNKVRSSALTEPMVVYNRYNTTYARDSQGDIYATGIRPQGIVPFTVAPGQVGNPEGTAGWANDWATISAVTGMPMDERALMPVDQPFEEWPSLEDWADESNPNGYSKLYNEWHSVNAANEAGGSGNGTGSLTGLPLSNGKPTSSSPRTSRIYGGGGGYSRGGGGGYSSGGGGNYYPTIRSDWNTPNITSPYSMGRVNTRSTTFDYLRPAFETKGSREAYRREDI